MRILRVRIFCFWENSVLREFCDAGFLRDGASQFNVLFRDSANRHSGHGVRVGHFRDTHDHRGRRSFLRKQVIISANDRSIPNDAAIRQRCARFKKIRTGEALVCWGNARLRRGYGW